MNKSYKHLTIAQRHEIKAFQQVGWFKGVYRSEEFIPKNRLSDRLPGKRTFSTKATAGCLPYFLTDRCNSAGRVKIEKSCIFFN